MASFRRARHGVRSPSSRLDALVLLCALLIVGVSVWTLERARLGVSLHDFTVGTTPVTHYTRADTDAPVVVIAHGFAGSRQIMQGYALSLAQAGYSVYSFDFEGHGRNPTPMSGDVTSIDGTTRLLVRQTQEVISAVSAPGRVTAMLGHSMATDILVRAANDRTGPLILLSAFSQAITDEVPRDLLLVAGQWEPQLAEFALRAVRMIDPQAGLGELVQRGDLRRQAITAPFADHVAILHSRVGRAAAISWLDRHYDRESSIDLPRTGWALLGLLFGIVVLAGPILKRWPTRHDAPPVAPPPLEIGKFALVLLLPALLAPLLAVPLNPGLLPVLVADHLALHLAIYGVLQLSLLRFFGREPGRMAWLMLAALLVWGLCVFGTALDRYGTNFWPTAQRLWIIVAVSLGTVPVMIGDGLLAWGSPLWQRVTARVALLGSLGFAVVLNPQDLFFLLLIAPVILLFLLVFGLMGRWAAGRVGPLTPGLALGLILAWSLGVSFPLFVMGGGAS